MRLSGINKAEIGIFYKIFWKGLIFPYFIGLKKIDEKPINIQK